MGSFICAFLVMVLGVAMVGSGVFLLFVSVTNRKLTREAKCTMVMISILLFSGAVLAMVLGTLLWL